MAFPDLQWHDWAGFAGATLMLLALFLRVTGNAGGRARWLPLLDLLGAATLLPAAVIAASAPVFFLLVAWILASGYGFLRRSRRRERGHDAAQGG